MAEVMNLPVESLDRPDGNEKPADDPEKSSSPTQLEPPPQQPQQQPQPPPPPRRRDRDSRERRDERDPDRPPSRRDYYDRNQSPPPRDRDRGYKRRGSSSPPPYRDRRRSPPPPYKRSRREDGGYEGRRGSPRGGFGPGDRRFGYDYGFDGGRYGEERGRYMGRSAGGYPPEWEGRGGYGDGPGVTREGLMSYKQFIQELEDDILPSEAERRYQEYRSEYISTQKRAYFDAHKDEDWLRDKYHPTNLVGVIERRNELARKNAKDFLLDLQSGALDLGPGTNATPPNKSGQASDPNSDEEVDGSGKRRRHGRGAARDTDLISSAPKAHPVSSEPRRIQVDVEQAQALVRKLDSEKGIDDNILGGSDNDKMSRDKSHGGSSGPVIIIRGLTSVKGLEGAELLDTLITYLWRIHGLDYYGMTETSEPKGLRHIRPEGKGPDAAGNGPEWEKKLDVRWQERLKSQDPLEIMTAKEKIEAAAVEVLDPYVRKIRDEKYGWKYGCGAKGCTKLFHAAEFVHKHLKLKHPELVMEVTAKVREELYFQNYMNDPDAPGGQPVMQQTIARDRMQRRRLGLEGRLRDDRGLRRDREGRPVGGERFDRSDNPQSGDLQSDKDGADGGNGDDPMFDTFGGQGLHVAPFGSEIPPPPVLMPVPGAGPLGPFVPAPPEVAMQMLREQGGPPPFEGGGRNGRAGPAPIIASFPGFRQDPRRLRSYQDLDAPEDEVTVIDYRSL
ncbi:serrate RNA effector molecule [Punica granatum]|uniref:C2H2-type domain-containing protein n=2 Tax=Punica granatum TaxID=22663 RepID=A0A218W9Q9_PUNGR|nr:serrate RNA effector molecule [Punica granatum]OWM69080.1 hypothetical protein CDL15_Pgr025267 [Punica granatum]PKI73295.1 hypothetical protein CRG98_006233 [Punica granatum]